MRGLADLRILVLTSPFPDATTQADINLLERRATSHLLAVEYKNLPVTLLRVLKRLLLNQDDLLVLYGLPPLVRLPIASLVKLWKRPVLAASASVGREENNKKSSIYKELVGDTRQERLLKRIARLARREWADVNKVPVRLDVGCGSQIRPGFIGIDARRTPATAIVADARALSVASHIADEVYASCLLEHFDNPHEVLREMHRVLRPDGQAVLRLPNLGTYSSHLDTTHRFLADLALWRRILEGYFTEVRVIPVGTKYRDNDSLVRVNWLMVNVLGWYELAQGWDFICKRPKVDPSVEYTGWWEE